MCTHQPTIQARQDDRMTVGHQLVELGNGVWEELVVENGRERWVRL
jgi:hypothetical protein